MGVLLRDLRVAQQAEHAPQHVRVRHTVHHLGGQVGAREQDGAQAILLRPRKEMVQRRGFQPVDGPTVTLTLNSYVRGQLTVLLMVNGVGSA
jgi:hypothetical protein